MFKVAWSYSFVQEEQNAMHNQDKQEKQHDL